MVNINATGPADINAVLQQMRTLRDQAAQPLQQLETNRLQALDGSRATDKANPSSNIQFGAALENAIQTVDRLQKASGASAAAFARGEEKDLVKVMIDSQKSSIGFQAMLQVRNRMVTAYQDIMNMPI